MTPRLNGGGEPNPKRFKENDDACVACLGLFSAKNLDTILEQILQNPEIKLYDCDTILTSISVPIVLSLRRLSVWMALIEKFPKVFSLSMKLVRLNGSK